MNNDKIRSFLDNFISSLIFVIGSSGAAARLDPDQCAVPTGNFPISPSGSATWCEGHSGVYFDTDPVTKVRSNYRWEVHNNFEFGSACWNGLNVPYTVTADWPDDPFTDPDAPPITQSTGGTPDPWADYLDPCRPNMDSGFPINSPFGFRAPLNLLATPGLGDFLPPSPTLEGSSVSLLPSGAGQESTWWNDATRQTLQQSVDLVTGLPLARISELELPFDGATFRLIRTRSGNRADQARYGDGMWDAMAGVDRWWDWSGQGWMINENPLLIIDSAVADLVGNNPRTTWLVLDAHHSIPFQQIESTGIYAAPPRFRAKLVHNGTWENGEWVAGGEPTQMDVYLYDGTLKYSFVVVREDIPNYYWHRGPALGISENWGDTLSDLHDRPFLADQFPENSAQSRWWDPFAHCINPGLGLPYLGLCVAIEDQHGHQVEINYCSIDQQAVPYDDESIGDTDGSDCTECGQACARKGLIRSVNLKTRGELRWSLLYAYRGFRGDNITVTPDFISQAGSEADRRFREQDLWGSYQIDRIYVYEVGEDEDGPEEQLEQLLAPATYQDYLANGLRLDHTEPLDVDGQGTDPLSVLLGSSTGLADEWTHLVQNHFVKKDENDDGNEDGVWNGALKVMTAVTSRRDLDADEPVESVKRWVFHHGHFHTESQFAGPHDDGGAESKLRWLSRVYTPEDVANVLSATELQLGDQLTLENLVYMTKPGTSVPLSSEEDDIDGDGYDDHSEIRRVANFASYQFGNGLHDGQKWPKEDGRQEAPSAVKLSEEGYLLNNAEGLMTDMHFEVVGGLVAPGDDGRRRYYRINRLRVSPTPFLDTVGSENDPFMLHWLTVAEEFNHRSAFVHPYQWHGYMPNYDSANGWGDPSTSMPPELTKVRWVTIIDEFADAADLFPTERDLNDGYGVYTGTHATKKSQLSRRVVELSPSGYLLRERKWEYGEDGVVRSGGGLGEQFVYRTIEDYFANLGDPLPADTAGPGSGSYGPGGPSDAVENDPLSVIRNELISVEHRSVGWSAGENDPAIDEEEEGYTRFTKYAAFHPSGEDWADYDEESEALTPASSRVQPVAEGFHRGTEYVPVPGSTGWNHEPNGNPLLYTTQLFRDPETPNDVTAQVEFVQPTSTLLTALPASSYSSPPPLDYRVQRTFIDRDSSNSSIPEAERPVTGRMVVGVPKQVYPGSPWYYPVEREFYDEDGNPTWACTGQLKNPENPSVSAGTDPYEALTFTYYQRDRHGRSIHTVMDAEPGTVISSMDEDDEVEIPAWPATGWSRIGTTPALNHVTSFVYDQYAPGLCDVFYPNGRRWARRVVTLDDTGEGSDYNAHLNEFAREFIYNDLEKVNGVWVTRSEGEVKDYRSTDVFQSPLVTRTVRFVGDLPYNTGSLSVTKVQQPEWYLKAAIQVGIDSNGRIQEATLLERSPSGMLLAVGTKMINDLGELYREQEIDETVTVQTRNSLGQTLRVYQGTEDRRWYVPDSQQPNYPAVDMVLLERTEYGQGVNDAWQPTVVRHYDRNPSWAHDLHDEVAPQDDPYGRATVVGYDWQNRAVRTDQYAKGNPFNGARRLATSLVYLDYLDRPHLEVTYGADPAPGGSGQALAVPASLDARDYVDAEMVPRIQDGSFDLSLFYAASTGQNPVSITQSFYGLDGTLEERREYDVAWNGSGSPPYLAEYSYASRGGSPSFTQAPGGQVEITRLDSLGRTASTITAVPTKGLFATSNTPDGLKQLTRTDLCYDTDGNVIETISWDRVKDDANAEVGSSNAVRTRTVSWYNPQKQLIATADLGTENAAGYRYTNDVDLYEHTVPGPGDEVSDFDIPYWDPTTETVQGLGSLPVNARVWIYEYDDDGNKVRTVDPAGVVTEYEYSSTNRLLYKTENAQNAGGTPSRMSGYRYAYGRLIEMNLVEADNRMSPIAGTGPHATGDVSVTELTGIGQSQIYGNTVLGHRTELKYGGEIVTDLTGDGDYTVVSKNNKLIRSMHLPNEQTGDPADDAEVFLRYTFSGQIAERYSGSGEAFRYYYDDSGRLIAVEAGYWDPADGYPDPSGFEPIDHEPFGGGIGVPTPTDKIGYIDYTYDDRGNLTDVRAWTERDETDRILITHNRMDYTSRDRMATEWQLHGEGTIAPGTPKIDYAWEFEPTNLGSAGTTTARTGHHRLVSMEYPVPEPGTERRKIIMYYGTDGSETDLLSRLANMRSSVGTLHMAGFAYTGGGRRSALTLKNGRIANDHRDSTIVGLEGIDSFGRLRDLHFKGNPGATEHTLYRAEYTYDKVGNRRSARITQADVAGQPRDNVRSVINTYDGLDRLTGSRYGELATDLSENLVIAPNSVVHQDEWSLDLLGNWVGQTDPITGALTAYGRSTSGSLDSFGVPWSLSTHAQYSEYAFGINQTVTGRDSIASLGLFEMYEGDIQTLESQTVEPVYDGAGRLVFDGEYVYQYDHWGRLVQVNQAEFDPQSPPQDPLDVLLSAMGPMLKHHVYDGLGRLVRTTSPYPDPDAATGEVRAVNFYYDGARRIQEVISDPVINMEAAQSSGDPGLEELATSSTLESSPDGSNAPLALQNGQLDPIPLSRNIHREYVWGPGDNGFDEILLQTDHMDDEYWCLQDDGGDLIALVTVVGNTVSVVRQWTYDAYGAVLTAEHLGASLESHIGHKGLFVDRLDVGVGDAQDPESPLLVPHAHALYHNRNRTYSPSLGRFLQPDPNKTAMALLGVTASHGRGMGAISIAFSMEGMYGDGLSLYQYLGSNPWTNRDPLGLNTDPFAEIDAIIDEIYGHRAGILSALGKEAQAAAIMAARIASYLPFPGVGLVGDLVLVVTGQMSMEEALLGAAIGIIPGGKLLKMLAKSGAGQALGRVGIAAWRQAGAMASRGGAFLRRQANGLAERAGNFLRRKPSGACGCFTAATLVWTAQGMVPIAEIEQGQPVYAAAEEGQASDFAQGEVGATIFIGEASLVKLAVRHQDGSPETISTTDEHPFHVVNTDTWTRADRLQVGDHLSAISGLAELIAVEFGTERVPVYNLSIPGSPTYYVGTHGMWVHNCSKYAIRNQHLAGKAHPVTGVPFDALGYPKFSHQGEIVLPSGHAGRATDFREADRMFGINEEYRRQNNLTWHHHQDGNTMQLVDSNIHRQTGHTGSTPGP